MYNNPQQILDTWLEGVNAGDAEKVLFLYHKDAVLLPTFANRVLADRSSIEQYFEKLARLGVKCVTPHPETVEIQDFPKGVYSLSGFYNWNFANGEHVEARFTFTVDVDEPAPILHHHSSVLPKPAE